MTANAPVVEDLPDVDYHAHPALSSTGARLLTPPSTPAHFRYAERKQSRALDVGHVAHRLILGKGAEFTVLDPAVHGLKRDGTPADNPRATADWKLAETAARAVGLVPIHIDDYRRAEQMADAVRAHPFTGPLFEDGRAEVSLFATDPETGVELRARCDWLTGPAWSPRLWIVDAKTALTAHPETWARKAGDLGYHQQAAFYREVAILCGLDPNPAFVFVVVEKTVPHLVTAPELDADAIAEGNRLNRAAIRLYAQCLESGDWPGYPNTDTVVGVSLPPWAIRKQTLAELLETEENQ